MRRQNIWKTPLTGIAVSIALVAQQPAKIEFEAVSIKPADAGAVARMTLPGQGGFRGRNFRLLDLIMSAWQLNREQIIGGPPWLEKTGWDIDTRLPAGASYAQQPQMLQAMLADRFRLVTHRETRALPVYALTLAKGEVKLHKVLLPFGGMSAGPRLIRYDAGTMGELAGQLSSYLGRNVIDRTGITGRYAINLSFAAVDPGAPDAAQDSAPSIFQALQDQAGLKLESSKGPVEVLVIENAEKPTPN